MDDILQEIYNEEVDKQSGISPTLFEANKDAFHKAIDNGFINSANEEIDTDEEFVKALKHSADVFSLHRTATQSKLLAERMIDADGNLKSFAQFVKDTRPINEHYNKAWLRTEYDTAILRAQMAADWKVYERDADIFPNLRWMQTTSITPRETHAEFWMANLTLPIDDPFWDQHRPGDQWNCKCYLQQTNEPATTKKDMPDAANMPEPKAGLKGNPAKTKQIFSQDHPYFPNACANCPLNPDGKVHGVKKKKGAKNSKEIVIGVCADCDVAEKCKNRLTDMCNSLPTISPIIRRRLSEMKDQNEKQKLLHDIQQNSEAQILKLTDEKPKTEDGITRMYEGCQGPESKSWARTKQLALDLNKNGIDVTFLGEHRDMTCADAIVKFKGHLLIADFKCSGTNKPNTLFNDLAKGYSQAGAIVLKLDVMSAEQFKEAINQFKRKYEDKTSKNYKPNTGIRLGSMIVVNNKGQIIEIERKEFINESYLDKIKGFL